MKQKILITLSLLLLSASVQAAPITIGRIQDIYVADRLIGTSSLEACEALQNDTNCAFLTPSQTDPTDPSLAVRLNNAGVAETVTTNAASYLLSPFRDSAFIDLGFKDVSLYNGENDDLVIFIVGHTTSFGIDAFDKNGNSLFNGINTYNVPTPVFDDINKVFVDPGDTVFNTDGTWNCIAGAPNTCKNGTALSAAFFDFGDTVAGDVAIERVRIYLGNDYRGPDGTRPRFSLAGGFHTEAMVVPLPLSAVLFGSGLSLLGWIGRRKKMS